MRCPDSQLLQAHLRGQTEGDLADLLDDHFAQCEQCLQAIRTSGSDDGFVRLVEEAGREANASPDGESSYQGLFERLQRQSISGAAGRPEEASDLTTHHGNTPTTSLEPGARIGDYRILSEAGRGGMGIVFEAEQCSLNRRVALKVLPSSAAGNLAALERLRREA